jgi:hypothetical protein
VKTFEALFPNKLLKNEGNNTALIIFYHTLQDSLPSTSKFKGLLISSTRYQLIHWQTSSLATSKRQRPHEITSLVENAVLLEQ